MLISLAILKPAKWIFPVPPITQNLALNLELNKVNLQKVKAFRDVWHQVDNSCDAVTDSEPENDKSFPCCGQFKGSILNPKITPLVWVVAVPLQA